MTDSQSHELILRMAELARNVALQSVDGVLADVTSAALELIPEADTAGILLVSKNSSFESLAATSDLPHKLDELQMEYDEGPCRQAALQDVVVRTDDFRNEPRWPQ